MQAGSGVWSLRFFRSRAPLPQIRVQGFGFIGLTRSNLRPGVGVLEDSQAPVDSQGLLGVSGLGFRVQGLGYHEIYLLVCWW